MGFSGIMLLAKTNKLRVRCKHRLLINNAYSDFTKEINEEKNIFKKI